MAMPDLQPWFTQDHDIYERKGRWKAGRTMPSEGFNALWKGMKQSIPLTAFWSHARRNRSARNSDPG
jgi:hypothetical protein